MYGIESPIMFKYLDVIIIAIILALIAIIVGVELIHMGIVQGILIIIFSLLSVPLYRLCRKRQKKLNKNTILGNYWHDMKCQLPIIMYGIIVAGVIVWVS